MLFVRSPLLTEYQSPAKNYKKIRKKVENLVKKKNLKPVGGKDVA